MLCAALKGGIGLSWNGDRFFSSGRPEDQEIPTTLHQNLSLSRLLPKSMPGQRSLCLFSAFLLGAVKRADRQHWAPKLVSLPLSPFRGMHEEREKESPAFSDGCKSENDFHTHVPGKPIVIPARYMLFG